MRILIHADMRWAKFLLYAVDKVFIICGGQSFYYMRWAQFLLYAVGKVFYYMRWAKFLLYAVA